MKEQKGAKQMSKENVTTDILPHEVIRHTRLQDIFVDYEWNSRSKADVESNESDGVQDTTGGKSSQGEGLKSLTISMRAMGQDTPVVLTEVVGGKSVRGIKTSCPLQLVCGFRRYTAATILNTKEALEEAAKLKQTTIKNTADGTIRAVVRALTPKEAKMLNGRENTERSNLKTPDLMMLVKDLSKDGNTQLQIAEGLGITQGYVAKLLQITTLPQVVIDHWREGKHGPGIPENMPPKQMTTGQMLDLVKVYAEEKNESAIIERYVRILSPVGESDTAGGKDNEKKALDRVKEYATFAAKLVLAGVLDSGSLEWSKVIGPKKKGWLIDSGSADQAVIVKLCDAAAEAYEAVFDTEKKRVNEATKPKTVDQQPS